MNATKFTATTSWAKSMAETAPAVRLEVYDALFEYVETGVTPKLSEAAAAAFGFIKTDIDQNVDRMIEVCEKRKAAVLKRWNRAGDTAVAPAAARPERRAEP